MRCAIVAVSIPSTASCRISISRRERPGLSLVVGIVDSCVGFSQPVVVADDVRRVESPRLAAAITSTVCASETCRPMTATAPAASSGDAVLSSWQSSMTTILVLGSAVTRDRVRCRPRRGKAQEQITTRSQPRCDPTTVSKVASAERTTSMPCAVNAAEIRSAMRSCAVTTQTRHRMSTEVTSGGSIMEFREGMIGNCRMNRGRAGQHSFKNSRDSRSNSSW